MLQQIRAEGAKPPFFLVHGLHGVVPFARAMESTLDRDRPLYALQARGIVGTEPPHERMEDVQRAYLEEIRAARPGGPYVLGGMCAGTILALDLARALAAQGERVGTVILVDPPLLPPGGRPLGNLKGNPREDPGLYRQLYATVEVSLRNHEYNFSNMPFDVRDPVQLHKAVEVGISMLDLFCRHVPSPFDGATEFIISADRAFGQFHPETPWRRIVPRPGRVHVIPGNHNDLFIRDLTVMLRLVQFALDSAFATQASDSGGPAHAPLR